MAGAQLSLLLRHIRRWAGESTTRDLTDQQLLDRFVRRREEAAFARLVERHGPMVLRVCQRVLGDHPAAEDAFQATFLVLVRKARAIGRRDLLSNWLYGVAYRTAARAKVEAAKRHRHETQTKPRPSVDPLAEVSGRELCAVLDDELNRLPEGYRGPLRLCYLEGQTRDQAAQQLGWSLRTLDRRLERGRKLLQIRLTRRGFTLSAALLTTGLIPQSSSAALPVHLVAATARAAKLLAAGKAAVATGACTSVVELSEGILKGMFWSKMKVLAALLVTCLAAAGGGVLAYQAVAPKRPDAKQADTTRAPAIRAAGEPKAATAKQIRTDRYGDPLPDQALARLGTVRFRTSKGILHSLAFTSDEKGLVTGSATSDRMVGLWDVATGKEIQRLGEIPQPINALTLSPDGKVVASAAFDKTIYLWDLATGKELRQIAGAPMWVSVLAFSPDAKTLASGGDDFTIRLWDVYTGAEVRRFPGHQPSDHIRCLAFSPDGKTLASGAADKTIRLWDVATGNELHKIEGPWILVFSLAFSPDGRTLASSGRDDNVIRLWEVTTGKALRSLQGHQDSAYTVAFSADGKLASGGGGFGSDKTIRIWDPAKGKELRQIAGHAGGVTSLVFSPDGTTLASAGDDNTIRFWEVATGKELHPLEEHQGPILSVTYARDGRTLATGSADGTIRLWEPLTGKHLARLGPQPGWLGQPTFAPDGKLLASVGTENTIRLWEVATAKEVRRFKVNGYQPAVPWLRSVAFSPDCRLLASAEEDKGIGIWEMATGKELRRLPERGEIITVVFSPDGRTLASGSGSGRAGTSTIHLWDVDSGRQLREWATPQALVHSLLFSPDSKALAVLGLREGIRLFAVATGKERRHFLSPSQSGVWSATFSPDGRTLAATYENQGIYLWETATARERARLEGHRSGVMSVAFSPNGKTLVSGSGDTTALVWDVTGRVREKGKQPAGPVPGEQEGHWSDLASKDAAKAYQALWSLAAMPEQAVPFLQKHLRPVPPVDAQHVVWLLTDLESDQFAVRQKASQELEQLGEQAEPTMRQALRAQPALEKRRRIERLLAKLEEVPPLENLRTLRAIEVLEHIGTPAAGHLLAMLAKGAPEARLTQEAKAALERLARRTATAP